MGFNSAFKGLIFGVNTIICGLLGRANEDNAILREDGNGLSADTV